MFESYSCRIFVFTPEKIFKNILGKCWAYSSCRRHTRILSFLYIICCIKNYSSWISLQRWIHESYIKSCWSLTHSFKNFKCWSKCCETYSIVLSLINDKHPLCITSLWCFEFSSKRSVFESIVLSINHKLIFEFCSTFLLNFLKSCLNFERNFTLSLEIVEHSSRMWKFVSSSYLHNWHRGVMHSSLLYKL